MNLCTNQVEIDFPSCVGSGFVVEKIVRVSREIARKEAEKSMSLI